MDALRGFVHVFEPGSPDLPALLLLHGTGGDENDLLPLGRSILPGAALLSPRGRVSEAGMPRFFRRLAPGVFDEEDIRARAAELAGFVAAARDTHGLQSVCAVGLSNGANMAAAMLLLHPELLQSAVLFRAQMPLTQQPRPDLRGVRVLMLAADHDEFALRGQVDRLYDALNELDASVTVEWLPAGHALTHADLEIAQRWMREHEVVRAQEVRTHG